MFYKPYVYLGKSFHKVLLPFLSLGKEKRLRIAVLNGNNEILLVRNWLGQQNWSLPGGGSKTSEKPEQAGARELYEETGLHIAADRLRYLTSYPCYESSKPFEVDVYSTSLQEESYSLSNKRRFEIIEKKWHSVAALPAELALPIAKIAKEIR